MKLLIAIPCMDYMHVEFCKSLIGLVEELKEQKIEYEIVFQSGTLVYVARDKLASRAIQCGYTDVLWLDSDMVFQPKILEDLMFSGNDFVSGIYQARRKPHGSVLFSEIKPDVKAFEEYPTDTFEIKACGFGCVYMKPWILAKVMEKYGTCFTPIKEYGEDLTFCLRAAELGVKMYAEPFVRLGHIGHIVIDETDHEFWKQTISNYSFP